MKGVSMDYRQPRPTKEVAGAKLKYQSLLMDYLDLQKEFVSRKRKLQAAKVNRENLLSEVRFLRKRCKCLLKLKSAKDEVEFIQLNSDISGQLPAKEENYNVNEGAPKQQSPVVNAEDIVCEPPRVEKKPKNCLINDTIVEQNKISLQDRLVLEV